MIKLTVNNLTPRLQRISREIKNLPKEAYEKFKDITPEKTSNAKRNTKLRGNTIVANYNYAEVLDKGRHMTNRGMRGSKDAPKGMTKPTIEFVKKRLGQIFRKK